MAKKSSKPNIPQEVLDRARKQAAGEVDESTSNKAAAEAAATERARRRAERRAARASSSPGITSTRTLADQRQRKSDSMNSEMIQTLLANPTKTVTEEELRTEYGHVIADIRNMFALAAVLMVALVVMAQFI